MIIRAAQERDLTSILAIYNEAVANTTATYDYEPNTLDHRLNWYQEHLRLKLPIFVAEELTGQITGWSSLSRYHDRPGFCYTVESSVYVEANYRGQGIGSRLVLPLIEAAKSLQLHAIIAAIDATNNVSIQLHERLDFKKVAYFPQVGFKFGRWLDLVYLQLLLQENSPSPPESL